MPKSSGIKFNFKHAALLLSRGEISQKEIALCLGVSEPTVTRFLQRAFEEDKILKRLAPELLLDIDEIEQLKRDLEFNQKRTDLFKKFEALPNARLSYLGVYGGGKSRKLDVKNNFTALANGAAEYVIEYMCDKQKNIRYVGILWGETIRSLIDAIQDQYHGKSIDQHIHKHFMSVCGDSSQAMADSSQRGSNLIAKLYKTFTGSEQNDFSFSVSASIPGRFEGPQVDIIRDFIMEVGGFSNVFRLENNQLRLKENLDILLTSCSGNSKYNDAWLTDCAKMEGIKPRELEEITIGNIGGYWLPKKDIDKDQLAVLDGINARWNGIGIDDYRNLAEKNAVFLIAGGAHKADLIIHLITEGLVNHLLITADLADEIEDLL